LGHLLIAGMTGSGKSTFLRLLIYQALRASLGLMLADLDGVGFAPLADHPALLRPLATDPPSAHNLIRSALAECERRKALFTSAPGFPEKLADYNRTAATKCNFAEPLPRILVVIDEFNALMAAAGGTNSDFAKDAAMLSWRARKFGIHFVAAAQAFEKATVGKVRDQMHPVCFRVELASTARMIGCRGAESIRTPGRAVRPDGRMQSYYLPKSVLITPRPARSTRTEGTRCRRPKRRRRTCRPPSRRSGSPASARWARRA
jgi:DNA segregation ATPase FtsK/SpoIIIE-like protein